MKYHGFHCTRLFINAHLSRIDETLDAPFDGLTLANYSTGDQRRRVGHGVLRLDTDRVMRDCIARLVAAGYVEEWKELVDRKPRTSYQLTAAERKAFRQYRKTWHRLIGGGSIRDLTYQQSSL